MDIYLGMADIVFVGARACLIFVIDMFVICFDIRWICLICFLLFIRYRFDKFLYALLSIFDVGLILVDMC